MIYSNFYYTNYLYNKKKEINKIFYSLSIFKNKRKILINK